MTVIELESVDKIYKRYTVPVNSLKSFFLHYKTYKKAQNAVDTLEVVRDLTMNVSQGEILCIVGYNGAGKSTLAKLIAGTTKPTSGKVTIHGRIVPFLELGVAFSNELTGRDNVYINGVLLGLRWQYLHGKMNEIFEYAEISDFIDTPLKYYSSGMQMRLAFSIGMHADGDIYIFDEILAVGDVNFQKKCFSSFKSLMERGKTIILITHDFSIVRKYATKILFLGKGKHEIISGKDLISQMEEDQMRAFM